MNNHTLSNKRVFLIATMLSAMMLAASSMPSLVSTRAFAQDYVPDVDAILAQANVNSEGEEEDVSDVDAAASAANNEEEDAAPDVDESTTQVNVNSNNQEDVSQNEEGDNSVTVNPLVQTSVQPDLNVNVDTHVIMDEEDCEEASDDVTQANVQDSNQQGRSEGEVPDNGVYVGPTIQLSEQLSFNVNADVDVILAEGCNPPSDELTQASLQNSEQGIDSEIEGSGTGNTVIIPAYQRSGQTAEHVDINRDIIRPVALLQ